MGVLDLADIGDTENCDRAGLVFPVLPARTVAVCLCDGQDFFETALGLLECEEVGYFSRLIYPTCSYDWALGFLRIRAVFPPLGSIARPISGNRYDISLQRLACSQRQRSCGDRLLECLMCF